jgi:Tfp pilus assembly protein PilO
MPRDFTVQKRIILIALGVLLAADFGLAFYSWELSSAPQTSQRAFDEQNLKLKVLRGDIHSAQSIKDDMPNTRKDCEKFEQSLPAESTSSSSVIAELDEIAKKSSLQIVTLTEHRKEITNRGMVEEIIEATISGDYGSVVRFVNGLQQSKRFYVLDGLALGTDSQGQAAASGPIRVGVHIRTYLREGV